MVVEICECFRCFHIFLLSLNILNLQIICLRNSSLIPKPLIWCFWCCFCNYTHKTVLQSFLIVSCLLSLSGLLARFWINIYKIFVQLLYLHPVRFHFIIIIIKMNDSDDLISCLSRLFSYIYPKNPLLYPDAMSHSVT